LKITIETRVKEMTGKPSIITAAENLELLLIKKLTGEDSKSLHFRNFEKRKYLCKSVKGR
jgi:hypothetical protein